MSPALLAVNRAAPDQLFINGEWTDAQDGGTFETLNPATGEVLATVAEARAEDVSAAAAAARAAFDAGPWPRMDAADRGALLWKIGDLIEARAEDLARLEVMDNGKPLREARIDIR
jgi:acyl-CoA reductase-like NAD-dependent aldehyde dehydrogenase